MSQETKMCACGDRAASLCPGEWEQGCDLGTNEKYVAVSKVDLAEIRKKISGPGLEQLIEQFKDWQGPEVSGYVKPEQKKDA